MMDLLGAAAEMTCGLLGFGILFLLGWSILADAFRGR